MINSIYRNNNSIKHNNNSIKRHNNSIKRNNKKSEMSLPGLLTITTIVYCVFICISIGVQIVCKKNYDTLD